MLLFLSLILIIISALCFLTGYAYLNDKAEDILMWSFTGKLEKVTDKEKYKKQQGKYSILLGIIFFLVPVSLYFIDRFEINKELLYLWIFVLGVVVISNAIQVRKNFK